MYCGNCGARQSGTVRYCPSCGAATPAPRDGSSADIERTGVLDPVREQMPLRSSMRAPNLGLVAAMVAVVALLALAGVLGVTFLRRSGGDGPTGAAHVTPSPVAPKASSVSTPGGPGSAATPTPSGDLAAVYKRVSGGVIRIETTACNGGGVGSGFLVAPDLVATVAHVVRGANSVVLRDDDSTQTGTVIGFDSRHEVALVRVADPFTGHVFALANSQPDVGSTVAAIGYPLSGPRSLSKGTVSGTHRSITDTPCPRPPRPRCWTGGAHIRSPGRSVPAPAAPPAARTNSTQVTVESDNPDAEAIADTFRTYANGINAADYDRAHAALGPSAQERTGSGQFEEAQRSSYLLEIHLVDVQSAGTGRDTASVTMTSVQDAEYGHAGQTCSEWNLTYTLTADVQDGWLIDKAVATDGSPFAC